MRRFFPVVVLILLAAVPRPAGAQSREEREVRALLDRAIQAANSVDEKVWRQSLAEYSASGGPFYPLFAASLGSVSELEKLIGQNLAQLRARRYTATSPITVRAEKNLAWATYTWHSTYDFKDGTRTEAGGRATVTFWREGKNWKIAHWHSSVPAPPPLTKAAMDAEAQQVVEVERNAWEALKEKQMAALADYFAEDFSMFEESQAYRVQGKAEGLRGLESWLQQTTLRSYQMLEPKVQVVGDTALLTYYFTEAGTSGGKEFSNAGKISMVFVKRDGAWRALHEHRSINR